MVNDVLEESERRIGESGVGSSDDVRGAGKALVGFSAEMRDEERRLKRFLYARMYDSPPVAAVRDAVQPVVAGLYRAYLQDPSLLPLPWRVDGQDAVGAARTIGDYVAGMTDRFAIAQYRQHVGPVELPEAF
jgi:dGTPase